jgi:hypothetical protein
MGNDTPAPDLVKAHLIDQPRDSVESASGLEGADFLLVLAFHPDAELWHSLDGAVRCRERRRIVSQEDSRVRRRRDPVEGLVCDERRAVDVFCDFGMGSADR